MSLLAKLGAMGAGPDVFAAARTGPRNSPDLERVVNLPRRKVPEGEEAEALVEKWTARFKTFTGTMRLRPLQAVTLEEAELAGGLLGMLGPGAGKTIPSLLLFSVWDSAPGVLMLKPRLKHKLFHYEYPELSKHWHLKPIIDARRLYDGNHDIDPNAIYVVAYTDLSSGERADVLDRLQPTAIVCDEGHALCHASAARSKRFRRYHRARRPKLAVLSGTLTSRSLNDYAPLSAAALGNGSPLPLAWHTLQEWSYTLDASDDPAPAGALVRLCAEGEPVREGFQRRLRDTRGVISASAEGVRASLVCDELGLKVPKVVVEALKKARETWDRPDGFPLREAIELYALTRQLSCGFYYRRTFPRGEPAELIREWSEAKKDYDREVRERLSRSIPGQDSPGLLWKAAARGDWASTTFARWAKVYKSVRPKKETVWLSTFLVDAAVEWAKKEPGIVWVEAEAVRAAFAIASQAGIPVYSGGGSDEVKLQAEDGSRSVVASINAFQEGLNLQYAFGRNLVLTCPPSNKVLEQAISRTHRPGQPRDEVTVDFCLHTPELRGALRDAKQQANYVEETTKAQQKLNQATWLFRP